MTGERSTSFDSPQALAFCDNVRSGFSVGYFPPM